MVKHNSCPFFCFRSQVADTLKRHYFKFFFDPPFFFHTLFHREKNLMLLAIDVERCGADLHWKFNVKTNEWFPHLHRKLLFSDMLSAELIRPKPQEER